MPMNLGLHDQQSRPCPAFDVWQQWKQRRLAADPTLETDP